MKEEEVWTALDCSCEVAPGRIISFLLMSSTPREGGWVEGGESITQFFFCFF